MTPDEAISFLNISLPIAVGHLMPKEWLDRHNEEMEQSLKMAIDAIKIIEKIKEKLNEEGNGED